jgi:hypothetical protein
MLDGVAPRVGIHPPAAYPSFKPAPRKIRFSGTTVMKVLNGKVAEEVGLDDGVTAHTQLRLSRAPDLAFVLDLDQPKEAIEKRTPAASNDHSANRYYSRIDPAQKQHPSHGAEGEPSRKRAQAWRQVTVDYSAINGGGEKQATKIMPNNINADLGG